MKKTTPLIKRILEDYPNLQDVGYVHTIKSFTTFRWFLTKTLSRVESECLRACLEYTWQGASELDPWEAFFELSVLSKEVGYSSSQFSKALKKLASMLLICPICDKALDYSLITFQRVYGHYEVNLRPYLTFINHLQGHLIADKAGFYRKQDLWLDSKKSVKRVANMHVQRTKVQTEEAVLPKIGGGFVAGKQRKPKKLAIR